MSPALPGFVVRYLRYSTVPAEELVTWTLRDEAGGEFDVDLAWTGLAMPGASTDPAGCDAETAAAAAVTDDDGGGEEEDGEEGSAPSAAEAQTPLTEGHGATAAAHAPNTTSTKSSVSCRLVHHHAADGLVGGRADGGSPVAGQRHGSAARGVLLAPFSSVVSLFMPKSPPTT